MNQKSHTIVEWKWNYYFIKYSKLREREKERERERETVNLLGEKNTQNILYGRNSLLKFSLNLLRNYLKFFSENIFYKNIIESQVIPRALILDYNPADICLTHFFGFSLDSVIY